MTDAPPGPGSTLPPPDPIVPPKPRPDPVVAPKSSRKAGAGIAIAWLAAMLIVVLALVGTSPDWAPPLQKLLPWARTPNGSDAPAARLAADEQRLTALAALSGRVGALEQRPAPDLGDAVAPLASQIQQLSARLDNDEARLAKLANDEATRGDSATRVLMVALASLGNAIEASGPFATQLSSVEALAQNRAAWAVQLQQLEPAAKSGIPSTAALGQRFDDETAPAILRAGAKPAGQESLGEAMLARLRSLIIVRRIDTGGNTVGGTDGAVASAQAALGKGDLAGAVGALKTLSGGALAAAQPWLGAAQQRLDAEATIAQLSQQLASDLAAGSGGD